MSEIKIFDSKDYRNYLNKIFSGKKLGRGIKGKLAHHLNCQPSFISQVLKGHCSFSLEHGFKICTFLGMNRLEKDYFLTLIEYDRAGSYELKQFFESKLKSLSKQSESIENHMDFEQLSDEDVVAYYNNWNHVLIRNLIDIPSFRKQKNLVKKLDIDTNEYNNAMNFLIEKGLIQKMSDGSLTQGHTRLHVKKESPLAKYANITSRMQLLKLYDKKQKNDVSFGCHMTLPKKSYEEFKLKLKELLIDLNQRMADKSEAEMMAVFTVDLMEI